MEIRPSTKNADTPAPEPEAAVEFRLAKEYWLQTVFPYIENRKLGGVELFVAVHAHHRLLMAYNKAVTWNNTEEGKRSPVPVAALAELAEPHFRQPDALYRNENLKPETLAMIAAPMMKKETAELPPKEAVRVAHELLMEAEQYVAALPEPKQGIDALIRDFDTAFSTVTFAEIQSSNHIASRQVPLLPPAQRERNDGQLSFPAFKIAMERFFKARAAVTQEEYEREQQHEDALEKSGQLFRIGERKPQSYQEWWLRNKAAMKDCLENRRISVQELCELRWQRFNDFWRQQQRRGMSRKFRKQVPSNGNPP